MSTDLALGILLGSSMNETSIEPIKVPAETVFVFLEILRTLLYSCLPIILFVLFCLLVNCVTDFIKRI